MKWSGLALASALLSFLPVTEAYAQGRPRIVPLNDSELCQLGNGGACARLEAARSASGSPLRAGVESWRNTDTGRFVCGAGSGACNAVENAAGKIDEVRNAVSGAAKGVEGFAQDVAAGAGALAQDVVDGAGSLADDVREALGGFGSGGADRRDGAFDNDYERQWNENRSRQADERLRQEMQDQGVEMGEDLAPPVSYEEHMSPARRRGLATAAETRDTEIDEAFNDYHTEGVETGDWDGARETYDRRRMDANSEYVDEWLRLNREESDKLDPHRDYRGLDLEGLKRRKAELEQRLEELRSGRSGESARDYSAERRELEELAVDEDGWNRRVAASDEEALSRREFADTSGQDYESFREETDRERFRRQELADGRAAELEDARFRTSSAERSVDHAAQENRAATDDYYETLAETAGAGGGWGSALDAALYGGSHGGGGLLGLFGGGNGTGTFGGGPGGVGGGAGGGLQGLFGGGNGRTFGGGLGSMQGLGGTPDGPIGSEQDYWSALENMTTVIETTPCGTNQAANDRYNRATARYNRAMQWRGQAARSDPTLHQRLDSDPRKARLMARMNNKPRC